MRKTIVTMILALLFVVAGVEVAIAKEKKSGKDNTETVVYSLTPAPVCQNCVNKIKGNMRFEKGVKDVEVDLKTKSVCITYLPEKTSTEKLVSAFKKIGYTTTPYQAAETGEQQCTECQDSDKQK